MGPRQELRYLLSTRTCIDTDADPSGRLVESVLNGSVMQRARTSDLIFPVGELAAFLSADLTLLPGTVSLTGTPSGLGVARHPQVFLRPGDTITCRIVGIGELTNPVVGT